MVGYFIDFIKTKYFELHTDGGAGGGLSEEEERGERREEGGGRRMNFLTRFCQPGLKAYVGLGASQG